MEENKLEEIKPEDNTQTIFTGDDFSMDGYDKHIRQARNAIFVAAGILLLNAVIDASTIFKGIIFKIAIIVYLIKALSDAKEAQQMKAQMEK
jgi:hypothetical protein